MKTLDETINSAISAFKYDSGKFYGDPSNLDLGVGLIYDYIRYALYDTSSEAFDTVEGLVYILTHECDVSNERAFNDHVLICPIIDFKIFATSYVLTFSAERFAQLAADLVQDLIFRAVYIPPISQNILPHGGILYLNQITNTHLSVFNLTGAQKVSALSGYAQRIIDTKLQNHLLRPKDQKLPPF